MSELIWFSIPGAIFMAVGAFIGFPAHLVPATLDDGYITLAVAVTLPIGFAIHQLFRTLFELVGGWSNRCRLVISHIKEQYKTETRRKAFLVWEMALYSNKAEENAPEIPEPFREHNRDMWHYIISFWSCTFSAIISPFFWWFTGLVFQGSHPHNLKWTWVLFFMGIIGTVFVFGGKGWLTHNALNEQELAAFKLYRSTFDRIAVRLGYKISEKLNPPVNP